MLTNFTQVASLPQETELIKEIKSKEISLVADSLADGNMELYTQIMRNFRCNAEDFTLSKDRVDSMLDQLYNWSLRYKYPSIGPMVLILFQWSARYEPIKNFRSRYQKLLIQRSREWPPELYLLCSVVYDPLVWLHRPKQPVFRYMDTHGVEWNAALNACKSDVEEIFEEGLEMFPASEEIWEKYLEFKLEIVTSVDVLTYSERVQCFKETAEKISSSGVLSENMRTMLTDFIKEGSLPQEYDFIKEIKSKQVALAMDSLTDGNMELYTQIMGQFRCNAEDLTLMLSKDRVDSMLDQLYNWSLRYKYPSIGEMVLQLFQWSARYEPIKEFRSRYHKLLIHSSKKWPLELYLFCAGVEKECESIDKDVIDQLFEKMISLYGSDIEVKKLLKDFTGAGECYQRAENSKS